MAWAAHDRVNSIVALQDAWVQKCGMGNSATEGQQLVIILEKACCSLDDVRPQTHTPYIECIPESNQVQVQLSHDTDL